MSSEAEIFVLGGLIAKPENFDKVRGKLAPEDFEDPLLSKAFGLIQEIDLSEGVPLDWTTIKATLKDGLTENELLVFFRTIEDDIGADQSLPYWVKVVRKESLQRQIKNAVAEEIDHSRLDSLLSGLSSLDREDTPLYRPINQIPSAIQDGPVFKTGFVDLDRVLRFGPGHLMIIGGKTGLGKTSLGVQIAHYLSKEVPVGIISLEMRAEELRDRIQTSFGEPFPKALFIADPSSCSTTDLKGICKALKENEGAQVFIVDYLQLMREKQDYRNRHLEVSHIVRTIKEIAKEYHAGMIVISQISRGIDARGRGSLPTLSDLKESGDLEFAGDEILFVHQPEEGDAYWIGENVKLLLIAKNRFGKTGMVKVYWNGDRTRFGNFCSWGDEGREKSK